MKLHDANLSVRLWLILRGTSGESSNGVGELGDVISEEGRDDL